MKGKLVLVRKYLLCHQNYEVRIDLAAHGIVLEWLGINFIETQKLVGLQILIDYCNELEIFFCNSIFWVCFDFYDQFVVVYCQCRVVVQGFRY